MAGGWSRKGRPDERRTTTSRKKEETAERAQEMWESEVDLKKYTWMCMDKVRVTAYRDAIFRHCKNKVVLEIGTGAFPILAIFAAQAGAKHVYAIEVNGWILKHAQRVIENTGFKDKISLIRGYSTLVKLPEQVDIVIHEIIGNVATEEGMCLALHDAQKRFLKNKVRRLSSNSDAEHCGASERDEMPATTSIPWKVRTMAVPVRLPEGVQDWKGDLCEKRGVYKLRWASKNWAVAKPSPVEDIDFHQPIKLKSSVNAIFTIDEAPKILPGQFLGPNARGQRARQGLSKKNSSDEFGGNHSLRNRNRDSEQTTIRIDGFILYVEAHTDTESRFSTFATKFEEINEIKIPAFLEIAGLDETSGPKFSNHNEISSVQIATNDVKGSASPVAKKELNASADVDMPETINWQPVFLRFDKSGRNVRPGDQVTLHCATDLAAYPCTYSFKAQVIGDKSHFLKETSMKTDRSFGKQLEVS
eukprot:CAMPEP_0114495260 /NCGR_PEP_ID=MMETSP0109-20121206/5110_1 /TAXON_ID=29199 /ORGANISM="Chlorarachnion reptans, Strain CCCM449" /LENGTH=473 /DNA_ID=CAMNT_0001672391 /DNA_START=209 /DNA_END=1626 /DNA_ORIENTATION=-